MWPILGQMKESGFEHLAEIPFVISGGSGYHLEASRYLRERALLTWHRGVARNRTKYPTRQSLSTFASSLVDFLDWCKATSRDWRTVDYTDDLISGYQEQMGTGLWSASGNKLSAQTINMRVNEAMQFLNWAASCTLRQPFNVITEKRTITLSSHKNAGKKVQKEVVVRAGRVRPDPAVLRLPTPQEVTRWRMAVKIEKGFTKGLMCDLILETGIRREEACEWRIDTLPFNRDEWEVVGENAKVLIQYGAKGEKATDENGEKRGPARYIKVPLSMAERLHHYRENIRPNSRSTFVKANSSTPTERRELARTNPRQLFLSDSNGRPIRAKTLYTAWTTVSYVPFIGWSPHGGRHFWSCTTLIAAVNRNAAALGSPLNSGTNTNWILGCVNDTLMMEIQPQLGHVSSDITEQYLQWALQASAQVDLNDGYQAALDASIEVSNG
jgi:integrase